MHLLLDIDECLSNACPGNSDCVDGVNSYVCQCHHGYEGVSCTGVRSENAVYILSRVVEG